MLSFEGPRDHSRQPDDGQAIAALAHIAAFAANTTPITSPLDAVTRLKGMSEYVSAVTRAYPTSTPYAIEQHGGGKFYVVKNQFLAPDNRIQINTYESNQGKIGATMEEAVEHPNGSRRMVRKVRLASWQVLHALEQMPVMGAWIDPGLAAIGWDNTQGGSTLIYHPLKVADKSPEQAIDHAEQYLELTRKLAGDLPATLRGAHELG